MIYACCGREGEPQPSHLETLIWWFTISRKKILSKLLSFCEISFAEDLLGRYCCQSLLSVSFTHPFSPHILHFTGARSKHELAMKKP